jgi:predicted metal-dependent HD superfamily phosphohydrolase
MNGSVDIYTHGSIRDPTLSSSRRDTAVESLRTIGGISSIPSTARMSDYHQSVSEAFGQVGIPEHVRALIIQHHSEPHRHYHTLRHLELMLDQLPANHPFGREMMAATLFHDIIYEPARSDNEELSASTFQSVASTISPKTPLDASLVSSMILATKSHHFRTETTPIEEAINILLKADLSVLWHPDPQVYEWYAKGVRREYAFVPEEQFRQARTRILTTLRDDLLGSDKLTAEETKLLMRNTEWELG